MKRRLLEFLKENKGEFVSGEEIASELGVSRTSIWKIIKQMKEEGYKIDSAPRKGYKLILDEDIINAQELNLELDGSMYHNKIHYFEKIGSTSTYAKELANKNCECGSLIISELQIDGRGRLGRNWESPKGSGIWMSLVLRPDLAPTKASKITQITAAAVVIAVNKIYNLDAKIKWPNDIVVDGKKICGILTEMNAELNNINYVVVGIGVNVNTEEFPNELIEKATSISKLTLKKSNRIPLIGQILKTFEELYTGYLDGYDFENILEINKKYSATIGKDVVVRRRNDIVKGFAYDLNKEGELLIRKEDDQIETVYYGEVSVRGINGYI